ncbi:MAG: glycosyltransferase [Leptolyngbya sp. SIO1D8]|nr:glycosyltransferase [Leptolyngbya sp. SIO1D8]
MSVYNGSSDYLKESIDSVLKQSFSDFEFIIIDDFSSDDSWSVLSDYSEHDSRIRLFRNSQNMGLTKSLNKGLSLAKGEYIARQDADDISMLQRFEKQVAWFNKHPETVLISSEIQRIRPNGTLGNISDRSCPSDLLSWHLLFHNHLGGHSQVMFRREPVVNLGGYNEAYRYSQDYELWCRLVKVGQLSILPEALLQQRFHDASVSARKRTEQRTLVFEQVAHNIKQLTGKTLSLTDVEKLQHFWSIDKDTKVERFPKTEIASYLSHQLNIVYQAYVTQKPAKIKQSLRVVIGQKFLDWVNILSLRRQPFAKIQIYLLALRWSPKQAIEQWPIILGKTARYSSSRVSACAMQESTSEISHSA